MTPSTDIMGINMIPMQAGEDQVGTLFETNNSYYTTINKFDLSPDVYLTLFIEFVISILGMVANLTCFFILLHPTQRHLTKTPFLISLAISDILILYFAIFQSRLYMLFGVYVPGVLGWCNVAYFISLSAYSLSALAVALFTVSRALAIYKPMEYGTILPKKTIMLGLPFIWIVVFLIHTPYLMAAYPYNTCQSVTGWTWVHQYFRPVTQLLLANIFPDTVIFVGNVCIVCRLHKLKQRLLVTMPPSSSTDEPYNATIAMCMGLGVFHVITTLPVMVNIIVVTARNTPFKDQLHVFGLLLYLMATLNYSVNFILYMVHSQSFRQTLKIIFCVATQTTQE